MSDDLVADLRALIQSAPGHYDSPSIWRAIAEIERLRAQVLRLREALEPFAFRADAIDHAYSDRPWRDDEPMQVPMRNARRASRVLKDTER